MKCRQLGFTLVEIIIYIGLMAMVLSAMVLFILTIGNNRDKAYSASEVEANAHLVLDKLTVLIHSARSINNLNSLFGSDQGRLALYLDEQQTKQVTIGLIAGRVMLQSDPAPFQFISSQAVSFSRLRFTKLSDDQIGLDLAVAYGPLGAELTPEKIFVQTIKTTINLRK
jgi:hypothetical protein